MPRAPRQLDFTTAPRINRRSAQSAGLVNLWSPQLDRGAGRLRDVARGFHAAFYHGAALVPDAEMGWALELDGSDQYADVPARRWRISTRCACAVWVNTSDDNCALLSLGHGQSDDELLLAIFGGKAMIFNHGALFNYHYRASSTSVNDGRWHLLLGALDGGGAPEHLRIFVDGREESGTSGSAGAPGDIQDATPRNLRLGNRHWSSSDAETFAGRLGQVRLYERVPAPAVVYAMFDPTTRHELLAPPPRPRASRPPRQPHVQPERLALGPLVNLV